jgi:hypothetical protein
VNVKYNGMNDEKTMSDECWNELVEVKWRKEKSSSFLRFLIFRIS